ncbi:hypothetical protein [Haloarcula sp. JP-L23]|uniref:hypothetical protein n=1 Tax=Haloarcula sp. JP-L23 TaxID=2716717 RepID=UPI00140E9F68|nr:hypothetical protein G9465_22860 [Haloarcula sp. JP-L23]
MTTSTTKRFKGFDAIFGTDPDEIYIELRLGRPAYIRLHEGKYLQEGDVYHREQLGMASPTLDTWEIREIDEETVVGEDIETRDRMTWDREEVERGLAVGKFSTNLTDFETVSVIQTGRWEDYDRDGDEAGYRYTGRPYVMVVAYGDNGLKYSRRYQFVDDEERTLELWTQDASIEQFADEIAARFDERIHEALEADGYDLAEKR